MGKLDIDMMNYPFSQGYHTKKTNVSTELTKTVRQQWQYFERSDRYVMHKVKCRTGDQLIVTEPRSHWKKNFYRRQHNLTIGFFNPIQRPYQCLGGEFSLHPKDLILQVYRKNLPNQLIDKAAIYRKRRKEEAPKSATEPDQGAVAVKPSQSEENLGHLTLWEHVRESNDQVRFVSSGQHYKEANKIIQAARKKQSKSDVQTPNNLMSVKSVSSLADMNIGKTCAIDITSIPLTDTSSSVQQGAAPAGTEGEGQGGLGVTMATAETASGISDIQLKSNTSRLMEIYERERRERVKLDQMQKLEAIYMILLTLTNMKNNLLRNKNPMSKELLAALKKEQMSDKDVMSRLASGRYSTNHRMSVSTDTLISLDTASSPNRTQPIPFGQTPLLEAPPMRSTVQTPLSVIPTPGLPGTRRMTTFGNSPRAIGIVGAASLWATKARKQSDTVETWDDLMCTPDRNQKLFAKLQITGMFLGAINKRRALDADEKKTPLWQIVANEKSHISPQQRRSSEPEARFKQLKEDYHSLKATLARENRTELCKLDRERVALFEFKLNVLENTPALYHQHHAQMKRALKHFSFNMDIMEIQPSEWFQKMKEEVESLCPSDEDIQNMIRKMARFSQMDSKTILQAKAKLCMLMMSLPAYEICRVTMQLAFKFVLEEILLGSMSQLERWLKHRRLPMVLIDLK